MGINKRCVISKVSDQYNAFPYPERDPADEKKRLITGSPSLPKEIDHFLFGGQRDWTKPLRALVAGGGSGDALIQLATLLTAANRPFEITYLDLSTSARRVAEERVKIRGLNGITFHTDSLLNAPQYGEFDYIDCCGVLHHLENPAAGFQALRDAVSPEGGMGFMVYAPYGRSGVYPLQDAFNSLFGDVTPQEKLTQARAVFERIPKGHPLKRNAQLNDHNDSDAGFYDLLLHSQDRAYRVDELIGVLTQTDWSLAGFCQAGLYDLNLILDEPHSLEPVPAMVVAEQLRGTIKTHVGYVVPGLTGRKVPNGQARTLVPHLGFGQPAQLAQAIKAGKPFNINCSGVQTTVDLATSIGDLVVHIDGRRSLAEIESRSGCDAISFNALWAQIDRAFRPWGLLHYSGVMR